MKKQIRCAIYTRKSSEEGLEQDFNSLDAQREAGEAYIKSQMHEGWILVEKQYNDGGFSGGTMERPAFKELLTDIKNDEIDIVVVYKVDRLTRSLMDFSKIVDVFDKHETSFVSITQQFNTTTSMGRLTLNILLSFAQFEREVTGERIRDKFAASKKKGMWMNGVAPMGYKNDKGKLIEVKEKADIVRLIFEKYLEMGTVPELVEYLKENGICTKSGKQFYKGHLYKILSSKTYIGKIVHKNKVYEGLHDSIIDGNIFEKAQELLNKNALVRKNVSNSKSGSLFKGKLFDEKDNYMSPTHSNKNGKRYRYYVSQAQIQNRIQDLGSVSKISAGQIEDFVTAEIYKLIRSKEILQEYFKEEPVYKQRTILENIDTKVLSSELIQYLLYKTVISKNEVNIILYKKRVVNVIEHLIFDSTLSEENNDDAQFLISFKCSAKISNTTKNGSKIIIGESKLPVHNMALINAIVKSFYYHKLMFEDKLTKDMKASSYIKRLMQLRFLPSKLIEDILNGNQEEDLTVVKLFAGNYAGFL